jgi:hypothetical protein
MIHLMLINTIIKIFNVAIRIQEDLDHFGIRLVGIEEDLSRSDTKGTLRSRCFGPPMAEDKLGIPPGSQNLFKLHVV